MWTFAPIWRDGCGLQTWNFPHADLMAMKPTSRSKFEIWSILLPHGITQRWRQCFCPLTLWLGVESIFRSHFFCRSVCFRLFYWSMFTQTMNTKGKNPGPKPLIYQCSLVCLGMCGGLGCEKESLEGLARFGGWRVPGSRSGHGRVAPAL